MRAGSTAFLPVAAGAFIGRHSFTDRLGAAVPDGDDLSGSRGPVGTPPPSWQAGAAALTLDVPGTPPHPCCRSAPWPRPRTPSKRGGCDGLSQKLPRPGHQPRTCPRPMAGATALRQMHPGPVPTALGTAFPPAGEIAVIGGHVLRPQAARRFFCALEPVLQSSRRSPSTERQTLIP